METSLFRKLFIHIDDFIHESTLKFNAFTVVEHEKEIEIREKRCRLVIVHRRRLTKQMLNDLI